MTWRAEPLAVRGPHVTMVAAYDPAVNANGIAIVRWLRGPSQMTGLAILGQQAGSEFSFQGRRLSRSLI